jgi:hypothetical protein
MARYVKREDSNIDKPDSIEVTKFSEYKLDKGGLEHLTITQKGKARMLHCMNGFDKEYLMPVSKGDLIAVGKNHVWVVNPGMLNKHYQQAKAK